MVSFAHRNVLSFSLFFYNQCFQLRDTLLSNEVAVAVTLNINIVNGFIGKAISDVVPTACILGMRLAFINTNSSLNIKIDSLSEFYKIKLFCKKLLMGNIPSALEFHKSSPNVHFSRSN